MNWAPENKYIIEYYSNLVEEYGINPKSLHWGSQESQETRFSVLTDISNLSGASILDVGCGLADLLDYLIRNRISVSYTGYDLTPKMIELALDRFPGKHLEVRDVLEAPPKKTSFDYILASGIFNLRQKDPMHYIKSMVNLMFTLCKEGVAFNTLSIFAPYHYPNEFYADPTEILAMCLKISPYVTIRHDYMEHDFTVFLYKGRK